MLLKYVEKHLVTNRAAIPSIYLGASATPSNTRIIYRERETKKTTEEARPARASTNEKKEERERKKTKT